MYRPNIKEKAAKALGVNDLNKVEVRPNGYLTVFKQSTVSLVTGKSGELKEEGVISPGQLVTIHADRGEGAYNPKRGLFEVTYNPVLSQFGIVGSLGTITFDELDNLFVTFQCAKKVDIGELEYVVGVYIHD